MQLKKKNGPSDRIRTCGLMVPNHARYQLRYTRMPKSKAGGCRMFLIFALRQKSFGLKTIHRIVFLTPSTQVCRYAVRPAGRQTTRATNCATPGCRSQKRAVAAHFVPKTAKRQGQNFLMPVYYTTPTRVCQMDFDKKRKIFVPDWFHLSVFGVFGCFFFGKQFFITQIHTDCAERCGNQNRQNRNG